MPPITSESAKSSSATTAPDRRTLLAGLAAALALAAAGGHGRDARAAEGDAALIRRATDYFDNITTLESRFIQTNPDGSYLDGTLKMKRPGRLRIDYGESAQLEVVADGTFFILVDHRLRNTTYLPLETTAAHLLLRENFTLDGEIHVREVDAGEGLVRLTLERADEADIGRVTVVLNADPMQLRQWVIEDAQGQRTRVTLLDPRFGVSFPDGTFEFDDPYRTNRDDAR